MVFLTARETSSTHHEHVHLLSPSREVQSPRKTERERRKKSMKLAYKNVTNPGGARCESARHSVAKWLQPSGLERDPAPTPDAPETPLNSCSGSTTPTHTQWPHQCAAASTVVILFQDVIRDHVSKSRLWSQHAWAEIRAIPLTH